MDESSISLKKYILIVAVFDLEEVSDEGVGCEAAHEVFLGLLLF